MKHQVILFDVKYVKNGKNYDVGYIGFNLDDLEKLNVKVTNEPVTAISMWGYTPVQVTGVLVLFVCLFIYLPFLCRYP